MAAPWLSASGALARLAPLLALLAQSRVPSCAPLEDDDPAPTSVPRITRENADDPVRIKGLTPHLVIHRKHPAAIERMTEDAMAKTGDLLQISYMAAGNAHGVILSLDDRGVVTLHHPPQLGASSELQPRGEQPLAHAYELDDARGFERFVFVTTGDRPTDIAAVVDAAHDLSRSPDADQVPLDLPSTWHQSSVTLYKSP